MAEMRGAHWGSNPPKRRTPAQKALATATAEAHLDGELNVVIELSPDREPWERQPTEPATAWTLFQAYRNLVPTERSVVKSYHEAYPVKAATLSKSTVLNLTHGRGYARRFRWQDRAIAFDNHMDQETRDALLRQQIVSRLETAKLGRMLRMKAQEALEILEAVIYTTKVDPVTGEQTRVAKAALGPVAITTLAKAGNQLERFALGMEQQAGPAGAHVQVNVAIAQGTTPEADKALLREAAVVLQARKDQQLLADGVTDANLPLVVEAVSTTAK